MKSLLAVAFAVVLLAGVFSVVEAKSKFKIEVEYLFGASSDSGSVKIKVKLPDVK